MDNYKIVFSISLIILIIVCNVIWKRLEEYLPVSEIKLRESTFFKFEIPETTDTPYRKFNVLSDVLFHEINEVFDFKGIRWDNNVFYSSILFFKDFDCKYFKKMIKPIIEPMTLIYFPENQIKWNSGSYLFEPEEKVYFFPEPNSILIHNKELIWKGDPNINVVMGKKMN